MIPKELAKKIRAIEIFTSKAVNDVLAGEYESVFKGRGMEFDEVREYQAGDDVRMIDWNVTARTGHPYVKRYVEERELTILFLVDLSASGQFGSSFRRKNEVAAEICALLAFSAIKNNDKVGLIAFTDTVELFIPPAKGGAHVLRLIRELLYFQPKQQKTDIAGALEYLGRVQNKRGVVFMISDFIAPDFSKPLRVLSKKHDMIAVSIQDERELILENVGLLELEDAETGESLLVDTGSRKVREHYARIGREKRQILERLFASASVDHIAITLQEKGGADQNYVLELVKFFRRRENRKNIH